MNKNPYEKNKEKKCEVCKKTILVDQYGNGKCEHCGWYQDETAIQEPGWVIFPNLIPFGKAKRLVEEGKPLVPSLEDFVGGLFCYREMQLDFEGRRFDVFLYGDEDKRIEFGDSPENIQIYKTEEDFMQKAHIDGMLLKDIWDKVENASYM